MQVDDSGAIQEDPPKGEEGRQSLVRTLKTVVPRTDGTMGIDTSIVSPRFYNCLNFTRFQPQQNIAGLTIGVLSAYPGEGKSLVAANVALSMTFTRDREVVLVDMNLYRPSVHSTFGFQQSPGLVDALLEPEIHVGATSVKRLHVLTAGNASRLGVWPETHPRKGSHPRAGPGMRPGALAMLPSIRDVLYSLQQEFDVIVVDLPSVFDSSFPTMVMGQMHGLILVVDSTRTTREDIAKILNRIGNERVLGVILNRAEE